MTIRVDPLDRAIAGPGGCIIWTGRVNHHGYGTVASELVHRRVYLNEVGAVPEMLDHLCHVADGSCNGGPTCLHRRCINREHLAESDPRTNTQRGLVATRQRQLGVPRRIASLAREVCSHGHDLTDPDNRLFRSDRPGIFRCRTCNRVGCARRKENRHARAA